MNEFLASRENARRLSTERGEEAMQFYGPYFVDDVENVLRHSPLGIVRPEPSRIRTGLHVVKTLGMAWQCGCELRGVATFFRHESSLLAACQTHAMCFEPKPKRDLPEYLTGGNAIEWNRLACTMQAGRYVTNESVWNLGSQG